MAQTSAESKNEDSGTFLFWSSGAKPSWSWDDWMDVFNREMSMKHGTDLVYQTDTSLQDAQGSTFTDINLILKWELFFALGREGQNWFGNSRPDLEISDLSYNQLKEEARQVFRNFQNVTKLRDALFLRKQREDESSDIFYEDLKRLASSCQFGNLRDRIVEDVFTANRSNHNLQEEFCKAPINSHEPGKTEINNDPSEQEQIEPTRCFNGDGVCTQGHLQNCCKEKESELLRELEENVANWLSVDYKKMVMTLPKFPDYMDEKYPSLLINTMSDKAFFEYLVKKELKGILLRDVSRLLNTGVAKNVGVIFVHFKEVVFDKFLLLKRIPLSNSESAEELFQSIVGVIQSLDALVDTFLQGQELQCCNPFVLAVALVVPRIWGSDNESKDTALKTCQDIVFKAGTLQSKFFRIRVNYFNESRTDFTPSSSTSIGLENWIKELPKTESGFIPSLLLHNILTKKNDVIKLELSRRVYQSSGGEALVLSDQQAVLNKFDEIFPHFNSDMEIVPNLNKAEDNILYKLGEEGRLPDELNKISGYAGETWLFTLNFIQKLESPCGVFLRNWTSKKFELFLSGSESLNIPFEIDWLYCGPSCVALFEIGMLSGKHASTLVRNKLKQVLETHVQKMVLTCFPILQSIKMQEKDIFQFFSDHFMFFIYCPNVSSDSLESAINEINSNSKMMENKELVARLREGSYALFYQVRFIVHTDVNSYKNLPECYQITLDRKGVLVLSKSQTNIGEIFKPPITETRSEVLKFLQAILTFGLLAKDDYIEAPDKKATDIESKYHGNQQLWLQKHKIFGSFFNIILSPQQYSILHRNDPYVCLLGEPGTGKTSLLIAKAIKESENLEIRHTIYVVPATKLALFDFVKKQLEAIKSKVVVIQASSYQDLIKQLRKNWNSNDPSMFEKTAMVVDEAYFPNDQTSNEIVESKLFSDNIRLEIYHKMKTCWLAHVVLGQPTSESIFANYKETFHCEPLNIIFRNSHHISSFSHNYIHSQKIVDDSTARVHGCFTSMQNKIRTDTFDGINDPKLTDESFLAPELADGRILIVFTLLGSEFETSALVKQYVENKTLFVVHRTSGGLFSDSPFSGIEAKSVLIIIDKEFEFTNFNLLVLAIARAQYEVGVLIHERNKTLNTLDQFFTSNSEGRIVLDYLDVLYSKRESSLASELTKHDAAQLVPVLLCYSNTKCEKWLEFLEKMSMNSKVKLLHEMASAYEHSGIRKEDVRKFIAEAFRKHKDLVPEFFFFVWQDKSDYLVDVLDRLLQQFRKKSINNEDFLSTLCKRGSLEEVEYALNYLEVHNLLGSSLNKIYDSGHTNLTLLCQRLHDFRIPADMQMPQNAVDSGPVCDFDQSCRAEISILDRFLLCDTSEHPLSEDMLVHKVNNMNVLEFAVNLNAIPMVELLLRDPKRCELFRNQPTEHWKTEDGILRAAEFARTTFALKKLDVLDMFRAAVERELAKKIMSRCSGVVLLDAVSKITQIPEQENENEDLFFPVPVSNQHEDTEEPKKYLEKVVYTLRQFDVLNETLSEVKYGDTILSQIVRQCLPRRMDVVQILVKDVPATILLQSEGINSLLKTVLDQRGIPHLATMFMLFEKEDFDCLLSELGDNQMDSLKRYTDEAMFRPNNITRKAFVDDVLNCLGPEKSWEYVSGWFDRLEFDFDSSSAGQKIDEQVVDWKFSVIKSQRFSESRRSELFRITFKRVFRKMQPDYKIPQGNVLPERRFNSVLFFPSEPPEFAYKECAWVVEGLLRNANGISSLFFADELRSRQTQQEIKNCLEMGIIYNCQEFVESFLEFFDDTIRGILLEKVRVIELSLERRIRLEPAVQFCEKFGTSQQEIELLSTLDKFSIYHLLAEYFRYGPPDNPNFVRIALGSDERLKCFLKDLTLEKDNAGDENELLKDEFLGFLEGQIRSGELEFLVRFCDVADLPDLYNDQNEPLIYRMLNGSRLTLFFACLNSTPSVVEWAVKLLQKHGMLQREMEGVYDLPCVIGGRYRRGFGGSYTVGSTNCMSYNNPTVLAMLCAGENATVESVEFLLANNFPSRLLDHKVGVTGAESFREKYLTALEIAENLGRHEMAEAIRRHRRNEQEEQEGRSATQVSSPQ